MEREVARFAARQHGVVAARQLRGLGLGRRAIEHRVAVARLHRLHAGVYAVGHRELSERGRWMAAVLAGGEQALLSDRAAAALWGFRQTSAAEIDLTVRRHRGHRRGIVFHQRCLDPADVATRDGIPVTAVPRTLLDLAAGLAPQQARLAFWEADRMDLLDQRELAALLARSRGLRGARLLRELAERRLAPGTLTRSVLERRFLELCRDEGIPLPATNVTIEGFEVDAAWPSQRLIVELDGYAYHRGARAFERDRLRDARLQLAGYRVIRLTARRISQQPAAAVATIRALLANL